MSLVGLMKVGMLLLHKILIKAQVLQTPNVNENRTFGTAVLLDGSETQYHGMHVEIDAT